MTTGDPIFAGINQAAPGTTGVSNIPNTSWSYTPALDLSTDKNVIEIQKRITAIEHRLAILRPNEELQVKYPALQAAYDHYKLIEKLVDDKARNGT